VAIAVDLNFESEPGIGIFGKGPFLIDWNQKIFLQPGVIDVDN